MRKIGQIFVKQFAKKTIKKYQYIAKGRPKIDQTLTKYMQEPCEKCQKLFKNVKEKHPIAGHTLANTLPKYLRTASQQPTKHQPKTGRKLAKQLPKLGCEYIDARISFLAGLLALVRPGQPGT